MSLDLLSPPERARIFASAALLFALSLIVGLVFTFKAVGQVVAWPLVPAMDLAIPGTEEAWRRAHLGGIINALAMIAFGAAGSSLQLSASARVWYARCIHITGWGNSIAFLIGAVFSTRGLAFGGSAANSVAYLLFLLAAMTALAQAFLLWRGARAT